MSHSKNCQGSLAQRWWSLVRSVLLPLSFSCKRHFRSGQQFWVSHWTRIDELLVFQNVAEVVDTCWCIVWRWPSPGFHPTFGLFWGNHWGIKKDSVSQTSTTFAVVWLCCERKIYIFPTHLLYRRWLPSLTGRSMTQRESVVNLSIKCKIMISIIHSRYWAQFNKKRKTLTI